MDATERMRRRRWAAAQTISPWTKLAAYLVPLCVLPSALWRLSTVVWGPWCDPSLSTLQPPWTVWMGPGERFYLVLLSLVQIGAGTLTVGLVRPWGEVVPRWVPIIGGRRVAVRAAVIPAAVGAALLFGLCGYAVLNSIFHFIPDQQAGGSCVLPQSGPRATMLALFYAPLPAWPPLLTVVTVAYHRRRTRVGKATESADGSWPPVESAAGGTPGMGTSRPTR